MVAKESPRVGRRRAPDAGAGFSARRPRSPSTLSSAAQSASSRSWWRWRPRDLCRDPLPEICTPSLSGMVVVHVVRLALDVEALGAGVHPRHVQERRLSAAGRGLEPPPQALVARPRRDVQHLAPAAPHAPAVRARVPRGHPRATSDDGLLAAPPKG